MDSGKVEVGWVRLISAIRICYPVAVCMRIGSGLLVDCYPLGIVGLTYSVDVGW